MDIRRLTFDVGRWTWKLDVGRSEVGHLDVERLRLHVERWDLGRWTVGPLERWTCDVRTLGVGHVEHVGRVGRGRLYKLEALDFGRWNFTVDVGRWT